MGKETAAANDPAADFEPASSESSAAAHRRWYNIFPVLAWLPGYQPKWLRADLIAWLAKAGVIVNFISESVLVGFKCGIALFIASTQLPKLFGFKGSHGDFWERSSYLFSHLRETNMASLGLGLCALAVLLLGKRFLKNKPVAIFVVIAGIVAASSMDLGKLG